MRGQVLVGSVIFTARHTQHFETRAPGTIVINLAVNIGGGDGTASAGARGVSGC